MAAKRARILDVAGLKGVSDSALECILRSLNVARGVNRHSVQRSYAAAFRKYGTQLSLPMADGSGDFSWSISRIDLIIPYFARHAPYFRCALEQALNTSGRGLTIIAYLDDYTAGNPLANDTRRKAWGVYMGHT